MNGGTELKNTVMLKAPAPPHGLRHAARKVFLNPFVCSVGASLGIFGGLSALFVGLVTIVIHGLVPGDIVFNKVGTILLICAIPMILIGSIFLDEIGKKK
jgi:hypothetical protein